jgi:hypothetical protein
MKRSTLDLARPFYWLRSTKLAEFLCSWLTGHRTCVLEARTEKGAISLYGCLCGKFGSKTKGEMLG